MPDVCSLLSFYVGVPEHAHDAVDFLCNGSVEDFADEAFCVSLYEFVIEEVMFVHCCYMKLILTYCAYYRQLAALM